MWPDEIVLGIDTCKVMLDYGTGEQERGDGVVKVCSTVLLG